MPQLIESTLNEAQRNSLEISEFIFHVVGPDVAEQGGEVDEVQLSDRQREFFLGRLKDVLSGTQYVFQPNAVHLKEKVEQIIADPENFSEISKQIANDFSGRHGNQMSDGIFVVAVAKYLSQPHVWKNLVLLIKMDKSASFSYERKQLEGRWVAVMSEVPNALNESKAAIQKSAVVDADGHFAWNVLAYELSSSKLKLATKNYLEIDDEQILTSKGASGAEVADSTIWIFRPLEAEHVRALKKAEVLGAWIEDGSDFRWGAFMHIANVRKEINSYVEKCKE